MRFAADTRDVYTRARCVCLRVRALAHLLSPKAEVFGLETRITHRLGKLSKMGLGVSLKSSTGVGVSLHLSHANQHVAIPMLLSSSLGWREALAALTAPHVALSAAYLLVAAEEHNVRVAG